MMPRTRLTPVPFTQVQIEDDFWSPRLEANRGGSIPAVYQQLKQTDRVDAFRLDWKPGVEPVPHIFWDSDVAKWLEGACYEVMRRPDPALTALVNEVASLIASAQQPDGYLNVHFTVVEPEKRWTNLRDCHELYCAGHLMEAAIAHHQATGSSVLLDALRRCADYIGSVFGPEPGKKRGYPGHEEIELALVRLYRLTGEERYLRLSSYFVEERGRQPHYFVQEAAARGETGPPWASYDYYQAHISPREQAEAVGHAVRAMYLYCAMADLAAETGDRELLVACERLWESAAQRKMYVTGGIGSERHGERFAADYDLPNLTAYAETCAAIGLVFFSHRMLQFAGDGRYADVLERALYNGMLSGVSLDGTRFFYENPLESRGTHHRQEWYDCACCPSNVVRTVASLGQYVYSTAAGGLFVHLYLGNRAEVALPSGLPVTIRQETRYPWEGRVQLTVTAAEAAEFTLRLRIPAWCRDWSLTVNGTALAPPVTRGYAGVTRTWQSGDVVALDFAMPVERVRAHPSVAQDVGRVALQRGPLVYCLEGVDHDESVRALLLPPRAPLSARFEPSLLGGVAVIEGEAAAPARGPWKDRLYTPAASRRRRLPLRAIPYYAWDNRAPGEMVVWVPTG
jgi:DUF1680 family protein